MDRRLTRRRALVLGAATLGVLRLPATARAAAAAPELFELQLPETAHAASAGWRTTRVFSAPRRFELIGLLGAPEAQVRARRRGGRWTAWFPLSTAHAPKGATDPVYTGSADEFQLRLKGDGNITARFVQIARPRARSAQVEQPTIIPRADWGADAVPPRAAPSYGEVQAAFVHHTVGSNDYSPSQSAGIVQGIARYHIDSNGWDDIGYNFLVDKYGQVFEGRAGGIEAAVIGAQAQGYNAQSTGIACLGTFMTVTQTEAGMEALARLIGWKLSLHGVPVQGTVTLTSNGGPTNRYRSGTPVTVQRICGHRDGDQTSCPGDALYGQLDDLRARAAKHAGPVNALTVTASSQKGAKPTNIDGVLRFADGSSPAGATLQVQYMSAGSAWAPLTTTVCAPDGSWATSAVLPSSGRVRAIFAGDGTRPAVQSAPIRVTVVPSLSLTSDKRRARAGTRFAISGALSPSQPQVTCLLEKQVHGGRWVTVQRKRIAVRAGSFATTVRPRTAGLYRVSILADGVVRRRTLRALH